MSAPDDLTPRDEERLARYRAGTMAPQERRAFEQDTLASDALSEALYGEEVMDALGRAAPRVLDARPALAARRRWWALARVALPAAASVAILAGILHWAQRGRAPEDDVVRGAAAAARPLAPVGDVADAPPAFTWSRDPAADSYRVDLFAPDGARIATAVTRDTSLAASALSPAAIVAGEWRVVPLDAGGLERPAAPRAAFRLRAR
jgi:hypothetical protein